MFGQFEPVQPRPSIILNTGVEFYEILNLFRSYGLEDIQPTKLAELILINLAYESKAEYQLSEMCFSMRSNLDALVILNDDDSDQVINDFYELGKDILHQLKQLKLYAGDYLHFQISQIVGFDMVLEPLDPPSIY